MANDNAVVNEKEKLDEEILESLDFDALEESLQSQLEEDFADLEFLEEEREKIGNPDALGKAVLDEVWKQFGNQIGLEISAETLIQRYDREHPETYDEVSKKVMQDPRYKKANQEMKEKQQAGKLKDEYTGKTLKQGDNANLDHTISRKEIFENQRRKQANLSTEDLANMPGNLNATNESLNKSKGKKSVHEMIKTREQREAELRKQNERANKKIDESNRSEEEKRLLKEKNNKRLQDKLNANDELMKKKDDTARKDYKERIFTGAVKNTGVKAGKDALKAMTMQALFDLLKEVMNGLVRFMKAKAKSVQNFLEEMRRAITNFVSKLSTFLRTGVSTAIGTIVSEIFGPIVSLFTKLASLIKQGFRSLGDAVAYLTNGENSGKPFSIKVAEIGKIIVGSLAATGAIFGGEIIEKALIIGFPVLETIKIPLLGSLANTIGLFFASMIAGVIGAIILNLIDKLIAEKQKESNTHAKIKKGNEILNNQQQLQVVKEVQLEHTKADVAQNIYERHVEAAEIMRESVENIRNNSNIDDSIQDAFDDIDSLFAGLED